MTILWEVYPFLVIFFLLEGFVVIRKGIYLFVNCQKGIPSRVLCKGLNYRGLDLLTNSFFCLKEQLLITKSGFYYLKNWWARSLPFSPLTEYSFCGFHELHKLNIVGNNLNLDDQTILATQSPKMVKKAYSDLMRLSSMEEVNPEDIYSSAFSLEAIQSRLSAVYSSTKLMLYFQIGFLFNLVVIPPLLIFLPMNSIYSTYLYLALLAFFWCGSVIVYVKSSKKLYGKIDWMNMFQFIIYPISLCRATMYLSKDALVGYNEIAVASSVLKKKQFLSFAQKKYELLIACLDMELPKELQQALLYKKKMYQAIAKTKGIHTNELRVSLTTKDPNTVCYCPICMAEYQIEVNLCKACNVKTKMSKTDVLT